MSKGFKEAHDLPRRFYKVVEAAPAEGGFAVHLDGRAPKSPAGAPLVVPTRPLAALAVEEWAGQGEHIVTAAMPATRLAFTAIDRIEAARAQTAAEVARYAGSDLLCYLAEEPAGLVARQQAQWGPLLDWARSELDVDLQPAAGILHRDQPPQALERVRALAEALDVFALAGLAHATGLFGSAVLGLALQRGRLSGADAFALSRLDEAFQEERWGIDAEAAERAAGLAREAAMLERWFAALR